MSFWSSFRDQYDFVSENKTKRKVKRGLEDLNSQKVEQTTTPGLGQTVTGKAGAPMDATPRQGLVSTQPKETIGYSYMGQKFDQAPTAYDQAMLRNSRMAEVYEENGMFEKGAVARGRANDARYRVEDLAHRDRTFGLDTRKADADIDNTKAATQGQVTANETDAATQADVIAQAGFATDRAGVDVDLANQLYGYNEEFNPIALEGGRAANRNAGLTGDALQLQNGFDSQANPYKLTGLQLDNEGAEQNIKLDAEAHESDMDDAELNRMLTRLNIDSANISVDQMKEVRAVSQLYQGALSNGDPKAVSELVRMGAPIFNQHGKLRVQQNSEGEVFVVDTESGKIQPVAEAMDSMSGESRAHALARAHQYALLAIDGDVGRFSALANDSAQQQEMGLRASGRWGSSETPQIKYLNETAQRYNSQLATLNDQILDLGPDDPAVNQLIIDRNNVYERLYAINNEIDKFYNTHNPNTRVPRTDVESEDPKPVESTEGKKWWWQESRNTIPDNERPQRGGL